MPEMDGVTATRLIREREAETGRRRTPIIALSANAFSHQITAYTGAGMDAHVAKPIDMTELQATIERVLALADTVRHVA
jgi:CheY-like chemotaxis protein